MNCAEFEDNISLYIDGEIDKNKRISFENHIKSCENCREKYNNVASTVLLCENLEELELPEDFAKETIKKVGKKSPIKKIIESFKFRDFYKSNKWRAATSTVAIIIFVLIIIGGQNLLNYKNVLPDFLQKAASPDMASGDAHYDTHNVLESSMEPEIKNYMSPDSGEMVAPRSASIDDGFTKKLIKRANIQLEVEELEQKLNEISQLVELKGGYVENSSVWSSTTTVEIQKNSNLLIRVPESSFDEVLFTIEEMGYTKSKNITGEDKTLEYIDIEARMRNMELHEEKLLMIMDKATNMQETIEIMREVGNIRADIESMKRQLKYLDNQIRFSTIDLDMFETSSPKSGINMRNYRGLWGRIVEAFILNVNNLINNGASILIYISSALPMVIVIAIIIVIILKIRRLFMNKRI